MTAVDWTRLSPRRLLLALVPALLLLALMAPAPASAQGGGDGCTAEVNATQDPTVANFNVTCPDGSDVENVRLETTESGSVEGDGDTSCSEGSGTQFECRPGEGSSQVNGRFMNGQGDSVCADPRLTVDFTVVFAEDDEETIENVEVAGCSDESASGGDEDSGATPEGGVDSGAGGTAERSTAGGATLPVAGGVLIVLAAGLLVRKLRPTR